MPSPENISLNKAAIIERCIRRMQQEYAADKTLSDPTHFDALILNIERACQAASIWPCMLSLWSIWGCHKAAPTLLNCCNSRAS